MMDILIPAPQTFSQLGILVIDGSGSMAEPTLWKIPKAEAVNLAVRETLTRMNVSRHRRNFHFAVVTFDDQASVRAPVAPVAEIDVSGDYNPLRGHGGGTSIGAGLREARRLAEEFLRTAPEDLPAGVVIVVMSDGMDGDPAGTMRLVEEMRKNPAITICSTYFAEVGLLNPAAENHLRTLASRPTGFKTLYDGETLRKFFINSVSAGLGFLG